MPGKSWYMIESVWNRNHGHVSHKHCFEAPLCFTRFLQDSFRGICNALYHYRGSYILTTPMGDINTVRPAEQRPPFSELKSHWHFFEWKLSYQNSVSHFVPGTTKYLFALRQHPVTCEILRIHTHRWLFIMYICKFKIYWVEKLR